MQITYRTGDMLAGPETVLIHGCNARGVMGSGVAKLVRDRYPEAFRAYREVHAVRNLTLGEVIWAYSGGRVIGNAVTQADYGKVAGRTYVNYDAVRMAIRSINCLMREPAKLIQIASTDPEQAQALAPILCGPNQPVSVAFPLIGAGLGGGSWPVIATIIEAESESFQPVVYTLDGFIPDR